MITIGLTTFTDHPALINGNNRNVTLSEYSAHFPVVELDTSFYATPKAETILKWADQVPDNFQFVLKANKLMTMHDVATGEKVDEMTRNAEFRKFKLAVRKLRALGQLKTVLFQFPPTFRRDVNSIEFLRHIRIEMGDYPVAVEFRNDSWFESDLVDDLTSYLADLHITLVAADEPHTANVGVPFFSKVTNQDLVMISLHGRNTKGWVSQSEWRKKRTLYRYSDEELKKLATTTLELEKHSKEVLVIFNNNAGHDAAENALRFKELLNIQYDDLSPLQLDLF
ncbi:DUF72 domain-containing protein [Lentilactobacillus sp. Marseille-Q4993]|uniref:DUF72 domain-containing protein n=1 Tax=Lentilactobacillus sp. Marseille-Q4993 TaxID=3039492 RepID=UPI0024BD308E|nr:DUF72 domain-containing protein [Lentilactobacillus sp. Marseille-Q4993]